MWVLDVEHGLKMSASFARAALLDEESGENQMGIGVATIRLDGSPQTRFSLLLASSQQPGQLSVQASHHLQRLRVGRIELDRPTDMLFDLA